MVIYFIQYKCLYTVGEGGFTTLYLWWIYVQNAKYNL